MKRILSVTFIFIFLVVCSGCTHETEESSVVCIVAGKHSNFTEFNPQQFHDEIFDVCYTYGYIPLISCEGECRITNNFEINKPDVNVDSQKRKQIAEQNTISIIKALKSIKAKTSEVDSLEALSMAADTLAARKEKVKNLVIIDSMLSTTGLIDFSSTNLINQNPDVIVDELKSRHAVPELTGVDVYIYGLGQTCGNQDELTEDYRYKLENIWTAIINAGNCKSLTINPTPLAVVETTGLPKVSAVPVISYKLTFADIGTEEREGVIRFDESSIKFVARTDEFIDKTQAENVLKPVAEYLIGNSEVSIFLAGMTATTGEKQDCYNLSVLRAEACKKILVVQGAAPGQIHCVGLGREDNCLRVDDLGSNGKLNENAAFNRSVFIIAKDSDTAHKLGLV